MNDSLTSLMPSKFLKSADFDAEGKVFTISGISTEEVQGQNGKEQVPVLHFEGEDKGLILKSTNIQTLQELFGNSRSALKGKEIVVYKDPNVSFAGKRTGGLRIKAVPGNPNRDSASAATGKAGTVSGPVDLKDITKEFIRLGYDRDQAKAFVGLNIVGKSDLKSLTQDEAVTVLAAARAL